MDNKYNIFKYKDDSQILDPLTCLIKLALLNFKKTGTKLSIYNNSIYFQESSFLQGPIRLYSGDNRNNLHNLGQPLLKATEWYNPHLTINLKLIYLKAISGLELLINTYKQNNGDTSLIIYTITYYKDILINVLNNTNINNTNINNTNINNKPTSLSLLPVLVNTFPENINMDNNEDSDDSNNSNNSNDNDDNDDNADTDDNNKNKLVSVLSNTLMDTIKSDNQKSFNNIWDIDEIEIVNNLLNLIVKNRKRIEKRLYILCKRL